MAEYFDPANLPELRDRIPDLTDALEQCAKALQKLPKNKSYLPAWEDLYMVTHALKGVSKLLPAEQSLITAVIELSDTVALALQGNSLVRDHAKTAEILLQIKELLEKEKISVENSQSVLQNLRASYIDDLTHQERLKEMPTNLFYVNEIVTKKYRETVLKNIFHCVLEDEILLQEIPSWRMELDQFLNHKDFGRGFVINFLPFINSEGSSKIKIWAWIALGTTTRAELKQRVKESLPNVSIAKV